MLGIQFDLLNAHKHFDEYIEKLAANIKERGLINEPLVRLDPQTNRYLLIAGEARVRALIRLAREETYVRCLKGAFTEQQLRDLALIDNLLKEEIDPLAFGLYAKDEMARSGRSARELAEVLSNKVSASTITRHVALANKLPADLQELIRTGQLPTAAANPLTDRPDRPEEPSPADPCFRQPKEDKPNDPALIQPAPRGQPRPAAATPPPAPVPERRLYALPQNGGPHPAALLCRTSTTALCPAHGLRNARPSTQQPSPSAIRLNVQAEQVFTLESKEITHMSNHAQQDRLTHQIAHVIHAAHYSETGRKVIHGVSGSVIGTGTAILTPVLGATLAPVAAVAAIGYGLWRLFKA